MKSHNKLIIEIDLGKAGEFLMYDGLEQHRIHDLSAHFTDEHNEVFEEFLSAFLASFEHGGEEDHELALADSLGG